MSSAAREEGSPDSNQAPSLTVDAPLAAHQTQTVECGGVGDGVSQFPCPILEPRDLLLGYRQILPATKAVYRQIYPWQHHVHQQLPVAERARLPLDCPQWLNSVVWYASVFSFWLNADKTAVRDKVTTDVSNRQQQALRPQQIHTADCSGSWLAPTVTGADTCRIILGADPHPDIRVCACAKHSQHITDRSQTTNRER